MKNLLLLILFWISIQVTFGQDYPITKMPNEGCFMLKHHKDTIYYGVNHGDSTIDVQRIYIRIDKDIYLSFTSDSTFEAGRFRRLSSVNFGNRQYIAMMKRRYWKQFNFNGQNCTTVDTYLEYKYRYIRILPFVTLVLKKKP